MNTHEGDPEELEDRAIAGIRRLLRPLDKPTQALVLRFFIDRYGLEIGQSTKEKAERRPAEAQGSIELGSRRESEADPVALIRSFSTAAELFSAAGPPTAGPDRALVIAAYQQLQSEDAGSIKAQAVQEQLKLLGYQVANITDSLSALMARRPQLIVQIGKSGKSRQSRKEYKVTNEGFRAVARMTRTTAPDEAQ